MVRSRQALGDLFTRDPLSESTPNYKYLSYNYFINKSFYDLIHLFSANLRSSFKFWPWKLGCPLELLHLKQIFIRPHLDEAKPKVCCNLAPWFLGKQTSCLCISWPMLQEGRTRRERWSRGCFLFYLFIFLPSQIWWTFCVCDLHKLFFFLGKKSSPRGPLSIYV